MRTFLRFSVFLLTTLLFTKVTAQTNVWTWVSGDNTTNNAPVYGTKGIADAANKPGNRGFHSKWMDAAGNLWIFGGEDHNVDFYNDLWKYTIATGQWTWVSGDNSINNRGVYGAKGVAAASNKPGARRGQASWSDAAGNFWLFGGLGINGAGSKLVLNDLWKFDHATGLWTWVSGDATQLNASVYGTKGIAAATNIPGSRTEVTGWADASGNFWIFGGYGYNSDLSANGDLNDLWMFNPSTSQWTWVSGDDVLYSSGVYGTRGTAAAANKPGARRNTSGWTDGSGDFWIFGGGMENGLNKNFYNDLWKYDPGTGLWTWVSGDNTPDNTGIYGTKGVGATTNKPRARSGLSEMTDAHGNFWFFGGTGLVSGSTATTLNDLWAYTPSTGKWTWVSGEEISFSAGVYGTKGVGAVNNIPGGREYQSGWIDGAGDLWIFGGSTGVSGNLTNFNDLWKFSILNTLPVRDISLKGIHNSNDNVLLWQTTEEVNTARFRIERSSNGTDFTVIGTVAAAGTGNNHYSFTDNHSNGASCYYRIKTEDLDGSASYSRSIFLRGVTDNSSVYPNPAGAHLVLQTSDKSLLNTFVKLYDAGGRLVKELRITSPQQQIDLHNFPNGVVWLQLSNGKVFTVVKK